MANSLHEYEAWLDTVDSRFRLHETSIKYSFDEQYAFQLSELKDLQGLFAQAEILRNLVFSNSETLPLKYMCSRLARVANQSNDTDIDIEHFLEALNTKWGTFYRKYQ